MSQQSPSLRRQGVTLQTSHTNELTTAAVNSTKNSIDGKDGVRASASDLHIVLLTLEAKLQENERLSHTLSFANCPRDYVNLWV